MYQVIDLSLCSLQVHVFQLNTDGAGSEELDEENMSAANHWLLPASDFHGLWDSLVFDDSIKLRVKFHALPSVHSITAQSKFHYQLVVYFQINSLEMIFFSSKLIACYSLKAVYTPFLYYLTPLSCLGRIFNHFLPTSTEPIGFLKFAHRSISDNKSNICKLLTFVNRILLFL